MRLITLIGFIAIAALSPLFAQMTNFQSAASGVWSDSRIWEKNESGVWLKPTGNSYPGDAQDRVTNVTISDGSNIIVPKDEVVEISSLSILDGKVVVEGILIIDSEVNDPGVENGSSSSGSSAQQSLTGGDAPQLLQNVPNPLAPQFGYETTVRFYLDKEYSSARVTVYDQLGNAVQNVFQGSNPSVGWHEIKIRLDRLQSGTYPLVLELPNAVLHKLITVMK